ncbi:MAG: 5-carboxymethyl-2-hydroxymuconate Delta-isomerase [Proteobacteria bacterium]|nr:5-carboxymethyl-2-hydroxymuconate Delta-isomerase [Pseudomonadota bacterium]
MPHLVVLYTGNLDRDLDMNGFCRTLADTMLQARDEQGEQVFPTGGTRVFALPAPYFAVADGKRDYAFMYLNLRMGRGRSEGVRKQVGEALLATAQQALTPVFERRLIGVTLQVDQGDESFGAKHSNIHPLFAKG